MDTEAMIAACLEAGAYKAAVVDVAQIPFDKGLRAYCEANACGSYGKNWACPPAVGEAEELIDRVKTFDKALVYQTVGTLEDSFDLEGMEEAAAHHGQVSAAIQRALSDVLPSRQLMLTVGGCTLCPVCARVEDKPCRFPDKALSSLEAYCINVSSLAPRCGMRYINGENTVTYFGAVLY